MSVRPAGRRGGFAHRLSVGMKRAEIAFTLETFGADAATARSAAEEQVRSQSPPPAAASSNDLSERLRLGVSSLSTFGRS